MVMQKRKTTRSIRANDVYFVPGSIVRLVDVPNDVDVDEIVGEVELYVCIWGSPDQVDAYGTWFDRSHPPRMDLDHLPIPLRYEHNYDDEVKNDRVGSVISISFDEIGIKARAKLDRSSPHFRRIIGELLENLLHTSSASSEHNARWDEAGRFVEWSLIEVSLTQFPAEHRIPSVKLLRSLAELALPNDLQPHKPLALGVTRRGRNVPGGNDATSQRINPMFVKNKRGKLVKLATTRAVFDAIATERAVYDADGNELEATEVLDALLEDGNAEELVGILQNMSNGGDERSEEDEEEKEETQTSGIQTLDEMQGYIDEAIDKALAGRSLPDGQAPNADDDGVRLNSETLLGLIRMATQANHTQGDNFDMTTDPRRHRKPADQNAIKPRISGADKYASMKAGEMAMGIVLARSMSQQSRIPLDKLLSDEYVKVAAHKMLKDVEAGHGIPEENDLLRAIGPDLHADEVFGAHVPALRSFMRANEVAGPGNVSDGAGGVTSSAWVTQFHGRDVFYPVREVPTIISALMSKGMYEAMIPAGYNGLTINLESLDFNFYATSAVTNYDKDSDSIVGKTAPSQFQTPTKTFTVGKLSAWVPFAGEFMEDSIVALAPVLQNRLRQQSAEIMTRIVLNGHTDMDANDNYNLGDGTPAASSLNAGSFPYYTMLNGLIKWAFVDAAGIDAGNTITSDLYNMLYMQFDDELLNEDRMLFVTDKRTGNQAKILAEMKTRDVNGAATLENGMFDSIWSIDHATTVYMDRAMATGKKSATAANNVYGRLFCIRPDQLIFAIKRAANISLEYNGRKDEYDLFVHMRWLFDEVFAGNSVRGAYNVKSAT